MIEPLVKTDDGHPVWTFDQLLRQRGADDDQTPLIAYPESRHGVDDFEPVSGRTLNGYIDGAVAILASQGWHPVLEEPGAPPSNSRGTSSDTYLDVKVMAVLARPNLAYLVNVFALARLGYVPFLISPRLAGSAVSALLERTGALAVLVDGEDPHPDVPNAPKIFSLITRDAFTAPREANSGAGPAPFTLAEIADHSKLQSKLYVMVHSSGSTGWPKPIDYTNRRILFTAQQVVGGGKAALHTGPMSHSHCLVTIMQAIYMRRTLFMLNGHAPQSHDNLTRVLRAAQPDVMFTVPYVLKLLAEGDQGIEALRIPRVIAAGGAGVPDDLGDMLVARGVRLGAVFGSTETARTFDSVRRDFETDKNWNYLRPHPAVKSYLLMKPVEGEPGLHEAVILDGHKGKTISNSDDPPNSYHTSDIFEAHPTIPDAWKFVARRDDRVTLLNGEKVLPLPMEGTIRQHALVREAVIFGLGREVPGLLLFRSPNAAGLSDEEFLDRIWPTVQEANTNAEAFAHVARDMIVVLPETVDCPTTDKASIKRGQVYKDFEAVIEEAYSRLEGSYQTNENLLSLNEEQLKSWIIEFLHDAHGIRIGADMDFFSAGVDSLKAIHLRSVILKKIGLGGNAAQCSPMIVYDTGTVSKLASKLASIQDGKHTDEIVEESDIDVMQSLVDKYSQLSSSPAPNGRFVVVLTGATGALGSNVLAEIFSLHPDAKVYCLLRRHNSTGEDSRPRDATPALVDALCTKGLPIKPENVVALYTDLEDPQLALSGADLTDIRADATHIIHCAWPVNFILPLQSFEPALKGLHNLLELAASSHRRPRFLFCSSIAAALGTKSQSKLKNGLPGLITVPETQPPSISYAAHTGYGRSKLVAENIIAAAAARHGIPATVFRIGQIVPGARQRPRLWNPSEAQPLIIRSATTLGVLPQMPKVKDASRWAAADDLARAMLALSDPAVSEARGPGRDAQFYNLLHPRAFSWNDELLPALKDAGLEFDVVSWDEWLGKLEASDDDPAKNPTKKLLGQYKNSYRGRDGSESLHFCTRASEMYGSSGRWERLVDGDGVRELVVAWKDAWEKGGA